MYSVLLLGKGARSNAGPEGRSQCFLPSQALRQANSRSSIVDMKGLFALKLVLWPEQHF